VCRSRARRRRATRPGGQAWLKPAVKRNQPRHFATSRAPRLSSTQLGRRVPVGCRSRPAPRPHTCLQPIERRLLHRPRAKQASRCRPSARPGEQVGGPSTLGRRDRRGQAGSDRGRSVGSVATSLAVSASRHLDAGGVATLGSALHRVRRGSEKRLFHLRVSSGTAERPACALHGALRKRRQPRGGVVACGRRGLVNTRSPAGSAAPPCRGSEPRAPSSAVTLAPRRIAFGPGKSTQRGCSGHAASSGTRFTISPAAACAPSGRGARRSW
jgi:hypothetical protein